ncbi:MAG: hypothetical protein ACK4K0_09625 [Flavobacteriales bacterium]
MRKIILLFLTFNLLLTGYGQNMRSIEDSLVTLLNHVRAASNDKDVNERNSQFSEYLKEILSKRGKEAFNHSFDSLGKLMCTLKSPDNEFRIFNWNIEKPTSEKHSFFCFILKYDNKKEDATIVELQNRSQMYNRPEQEATDEKKWYGALYYKIIPVKSGEKTVYTLLGWDGNNRLTNKKLIETMTFSGKKVKFGHPIFTDENGNMKKRVVFEYSEEAFMSLKYYPDKKNPRIIFDHLSPETEQMRDHFQFYKPDLSYDAYVWDGAKWRYEKDIDARNSGKSKLPYNNPE